MQQPQSLGRYLLDENIDACRIAARLGEAGDKANPNRVLADAEDDWDRHCCSFGRARGHQAGRSDDGHLPANQIGHQLR